jgi:hypothetical protein
VRGSKHRPHQRALHRRDAWRIAAIDGETSVAVMVMAPREPG